MEEAYAHLFQYILPGGLLVEGTSNPFGSIWVANVARRPGAASAWEMEAMVFSTNFRGGFDPAEFQMVLPKNLIHHVMQGEGIESFFQAWKEATLESSALLVRGQRPGPGAAWLPGRPAAQVAAQGVFDLEAASPLTPALSPSGRGSRVTELGTASLALAVTE